MNINGYTLTTELANANSGFSKWAYATRNGKEFFIKELISPVYPMDRSIMSDEMFESKRQFCVAYENKFRNFYARLNKASRGDLVRVLDFFRCDSRYYVVTEKVYGTGITPQYVAAQDSRKKELLLKTVSNCFFDLHSAGIVHFDVKPSNIIIKITQNGNLAGKLIDFDSGFLKGEVLENQELGGDLTYLAPETFLGINGEKVEINEKADIFALGLVFHEYYCGRLPFYNEEEYEYPYQAALDGGKLQIDDSKMPAKIADIIRAMLDVDPAKRPSAEEIFKKLSNTEVIEKPPVIKQIIIQYGGAYGKFIDVSSSGIKYREFSEGATAAQKEANFLPKQFEQICNEITNAGLWQIISPHRTEYKLQPGVFYNILSVSLENGQIYDYIIPTDPVMQFKNIAGILSAHCRTTEVPPVASSVASPVAPATPSPQPVKQKVDDWFGVAGDL